MVTFHTSHARNPSTYFEGKVTDLSTHFKRLEMKSHYFLIPVRDLSKFLLYFCRCVNSIKQLLLIMKLYIINGPNLNRLGTREPAIYGTTTMEQCLENLRKRYGEGIAFEYFQSNIEGELINALQAADDAQCDGIILNAGAYTHTSIALRDCIKSLRVPVIEVHLSNVHAREEFRHHSMLSAVCKGVIAGFGMNSYRLAVEALCE